MRENDGREKKNGTERKANRTHSTRRNEREKNAMKNFPCKTEVIIFFQKYHTPFKCSPFCTLCAHTLAPSEFGGFLSIGFRVCFYFHV